MSLTQRVLVVLMVVARGACRRWPCVWWMPCSGNNECVLVAAGGETGIAMLGRSSNRRVVGGEQVGV